VGSRLKVICGELGTRIVFVDAAVSAAELIALTQRELGQNVPLRRCYELQRECPHSLASMMQTKAR
jgi:hypothetical protein